MKLGDLRRLTVRNSIQVRFRVAEEEECVVDGEGICRIPNIDGARDINLEEEFARAGEFVLEPIGQADRRASNKPRSLNRQQLAELLETA